MRYHGWSPAGYRCAWPCTAVRAVESELSALLARAQTTIDCCHTGADVKRAGQVECRPLLVQFKYLQSDNADTSSLCAQGVECWAVNTDSQALSTSCVPNKLNIGDALTRGLGTHAADSIAPCSSP